MAMCQERKFLEQQQENADAAMRRLADQHRTAVAQLEHESLQLKHQLLRGLCVFVSHWLILFLYVCVSGRYGDGAGNTVEENSSVFSLIRMRYLPSML